MRKYFHWLTAFVFMLTFFVMQAPSCSAENWQYMMSDHGVNFYADEDSFWYNKQTQQAEADLFASVEDGRYGNGKMHIDFSQWSVTFNFRMYYSNGNYANSYRWTIYAKDVPGLYSNLKELHDELNRYYKS